MRNFLSGADIHHPASRRDASNQRHNHSEGVADEDENEGVCPHMVTSIAICPIQPHVSNHKPYNFKDENAHSHYTEESRREATPDVGGLGCRVLGAHVATVVPIQFEECCSGEYAWDHGSNCCDPQNEEPSLDRLVARCHACSAS